ncbi:MAG: hypothetical protein JST01_23635 [Cyanobacteria bacterium SZAS TMP-1]|nr:hypothetical protein [Cyanobacteria bacterium SZAS TMP-1]
MINKKKKQISAPPDVTSSWEEQAAYFEKYDLDDLESEGHLEPLTEADHDFVKSVTKAASDKIAARKARGQLNLALSPDQLDRFTQFANKRHIPPSTLAKAWILERLDNEAKDA